MKRFISTVLAAAMLVGMLGTGAGAAESSIQSSSPEETVYVNSFDGMARSADFNDHWRFNLGEAAGAEQPAYNDSSWQDVSVPHDFSIEQPFSPNGEAESGYLPGGTGWYRKTFTLSPDMADKVISIDFDGVYMNSSVWINGHKLGTHPYGYTPFSFVLPTEHLNFGGEENLLSVKVEHKQYSSRWYSGSGIYRDVKLTVTDPVHVARHGTQVTTPDIAGGTGTVKVKTTVQNDSDSAKTVSVRQSVYQKGAELPVVTGEATAVPQLAAGAAGSIETAVTVAAPALWSPEAPNLYFVRTEVLEGDQVVDTYDTEFGFRWTELKTHGSFYLNGEPVKLKGVCMHHDQGALGAEDWERAVERQIAFLKEMGCNSIRVTHNPASQTLIDICNEKGILLIDEAFDTWLSPKDSNYEDYAKWFEVQIGGENQIVGGEADMTWAEYDIKEMALRGRNSPSLIMWSIGNEVFQSLASWDQTWRYPDIAQQLIYWLNEVDGTRVPTFGDNQFKNNVGEWDNQNGVARKIADAGGLVGYNYGNNGQIWNGKNQGWNVYGAETASAVNSRGVYDRKDSQSDVDSDRKLTSYDKSAVSWGHTASQAWYWTIETDYNVGEFVWTGFDYIGEPTPWNGTDPGAWPGWPAPKNSYFGILDTSGFPKDTYYFYQSQWNEDVNTLHVLPTWDREDLPQNGAGDIEVVVYSDAPVIKLYLNGAEVGTAKAQTMISKDGELYTYQQYTSGTGKFTKGWANHEQMYATFWVPYAEGTLEAKAFEADGVTPITETEGRSVVKTTDGAQSLEISADRETIDADGRDLSYVTIDVTDSNGSIVNWAENEITVSVNGDGTLVGVDNGVQADVTSYQSPTRKAGAGKLLAIVQSTNEAGSFTVTAQAEGLAAVSVTVGTRAVGSGQPAGEEIVSYTLSRNYFVKMGNFPQLPGTVTVTHTNGTTETLNVGWADITQEQIGQVGTFTVTGALEGAGLSVSVNINMLSEIAALLNYSTAIQPGGTPALPAARPSVLPDGTVLDNAQFDVSWEMPDAAAFAQVGTVIVPGTANVFGNELAVTASVRVAESERVIIGNKAPTAPELFQGEESSTEALEMLRDGETGEKSAAWTGSGDIRFRFDTAFNLRQIKLYLGDTAPTSADMTYHWSGDGGATWTLLSGQIVVENEQRGGVTVRTVTFPAVSAGDVKLSFAQPVKLLEAELYDSTASFTMGASAGLSALTVNGRSADAVSLEQGRFPTAATELTLEGIIAAGAENASVTVLPAYLGVVRVLTESEDHETRSECQIMLDSGFVGPDNNDGTYDYHRPNTRADAPSWQNGEEPGKAVDGTDQNSNWHSRWGDDGTGETDLTSRPELRYIQMTLNDQTTLDALRYYSRSGSSNGRVNRYEVKVSTTELTDEQWADVPAVSTGSWGDWEGWKLALFTKPVQAKYVRLYGVSTYGDTANKFMSAGELRVRVAPKDLYGNVTITLPNASYDYTTAPITPVPVVTHTGTSAQLRQDTDYTLSYRDNTEPGTATVIVTGKGAYAGSAETTFTITPVERAVESLEAVEATTKQGEAPVLPGTVTAVMTVGESETLEVEWNLSEVSFTGAVGTVVAVAGTVAGTDIPASASVRILPSDGSDPSHNLALEPTGHEPSATKWPQTYAYYSSPNDHAYHATDGVKDFVSGSGKHIWSTWEDGKYHNASESKVVVVFGEDTSPVKQSVSKASVGFMVEDGGGDHKVTLPESYKIQYYTGNGGLVSQSAVGTWERSNLWKWDGNNRSLVNDEGWTDVELLPGSTYDLPDEDDFKHMIDVRFQTVETSAIRIVLTPRADQWVGLEEFELYHDPLPAPTYAVTVADGIANGSLSVDKATAKEGDTVTVTATADDGYRLKADSLKVCKTGEPTTLVLVTGNTFTMPDCAVTVTAEFEAVETPPTPCEHHGGMATCTERATCETCGEPYGEVDPANHDYGEWNVTTPATCTSPGVENRICSRDASHTETRDVAQLGHVYSESWSSDSTGHWHTCTLCNVAKDTVVGHTPGIPATETTPQTCTMCGYIIEGMTGHQHSYDSWSSDATQHWKACKCGFIDETTRTEHAGGVATCEAEAICTTCAAEYGTLAAHTYTWDHDDTQHWKLCSVCKREEPDSRIDHDWVLESESETEKHYECACGAEKTESVTPPELDKKPIVNAIAAAEAARAGVSVSDSDPSGIPSGTKFVKAAVMKALEDAINAAEAAMDTMTTAKEVEAAATALNDAVKVFTDAIQEGTYVAPSYNPPSNTTTTTEKNEDGSTTKTVTNKSTGTVTETTTMPNGDKTVVETKKDGTVTEKVINKDGYQSETVTKPDGTFTSKVTDADGVKTETMATAAGETTAKVTLPKDVERAKVTVPGKEFTAGTVAVIIHKDGTEEIMKTSVLTNDGITFNVDENVEVKLLDNSKIFADVTADEWYSNAVQFAASRELFTGTGKDSFDPLAPMSRAMLVTVLSRLENAEVEQGDTWYSGAMTWGKDLGLTDGTAPEASITRESLAVMLYRYAGSPDVGGMALGEFGDVESISGWASNAMLWCVDSGILNGNGGKLNPGATATRAEVAAMLERFVGNLK